MTGFEFARGIEVGDFIPALHHSLCFEIPISFSVVSCNAALFTVISSFILTAYDLDLPALLIYQDIRRIDFSIKIKVFRFPLLLTFNLQ